MKLFKSTYMPMLLGVAALTACVEDSIDLENIDCSSRIEVQNLVIPVEMDAITLSDVITIDEGSQIKTVEINGEEVYALSETGSFHSDPITNNKVSAAAPTLESVTKQLSPASLPFGVAPKDVDLSEYAVTFAIENMGQEFDYYIKDIDEALIEIDAISVEPIRFTLDLSIVEELAAYEQITFSQMKLNIPKGIDAKTSVGEYDPETGVWTIDEYSPTNGHGTVWIEASRIDFKANDCRILEDHTMHFRSKLNVESGYLTITPQFDGTIPTEIPTSLDFRVDFDLSDITADSFSGTINYKIDGVNINPVDLSDIPDFLTGDNTSIGLANPQIYMQVNNPVAGNKLSCETGIELTAIHDGYDLAFSPDNNGKIVINYNHGIEGPYNFVLAPSDNALSAPAEYADNLSFVQFSGLRTLLQPGENNNDGLPRSIGIALQNPQIATQTVEGFELGTSLPGVNGKYELIAPLALTGGSGITYSDRETGWDIDTEDGELTVNSLSVSLKVSNETPLGVELTAYPLDKAGNRISNVTITSSTIEPNSTAQEVVISMTGNIKGLDGIEYEAKAQADSSEEVLKPSMKLQLSDIRATVSGYYDYIDE